MRVQFDSSLDELVDANMRLLAHSRVARGWRWQWILSASLFIGAVVFALISAVSPEQTLGIKLLISAIGAIVIAVLYPFTYETTMRKRFHKYYREQFATERFTVTVELTSEGVRVTQQAMEIIFQWPSVETIQETDDSVDILTNNSGIVVVRKRAFETTKAINDFVDLAKQHMHQSDK